MAVQLTVCLGNISQENQLQSTLTHWFEAHLDNWHLFVKSKLNSRLQYSLWRFSLKSTRFMNKSFILEINSTDWIADLYHAPTYTT